MQLPRRNNHPCELNVIVVPPVGVDPGFEANDSGVSVLGHQQDNEGPTCELLCKLLKEV